MGFRFLNIWKRQPSHRKLGCFIGPLYCAVESEEQRGADESATLTKALSETQLVSF